MKKTRHQERLDILSAIPAIFIFKKTLFSVIVYNRTGRKLDLNMNGKWFIREAQLLGEYISTYLYDQLRHLRDVDGMYFMNTITKQNQRHYSKNCEIVLNPDLSLDDYIDILFKMGFELRYIFHYRKLTGCELILKMS